MRRMILTSLALFPVMAFAQASVTANGPQPSTSSANQAEPTHPAGMAELAMAAASPAALPTSLRTINMPSHPLFREVVNTHVTDNFADAAMRQGGTLEYAMMGSLPVQSSAPQVTRAVEVQLSADELAQQPAVSNVVVHATVDSYGFPRNLSIVRSANAMVDKKVLDAISQYRFSPATMDNKPVDAAVTIAVKIEKP